MQVPETILVGVSLERESSELLCWAFATAAQFRDRIVALHVVDDAANTEVQNGEVDRQTQERKETVSSLLQPFRDLACNKQLTSVVKVVRGESVEKALVAEAEQLGASILVLSSAGKRMTPWRLQGTASYCSRHSPPGCSVVVVSNNKILLYKEHRTKPFETSPWPLVFPRSEHQQGGSYDGSLTEDSTQACGSQRSYGAEIPCKLSKGKPCLEKLPSRSHPQSESRREDHEASSHRTGCHEQSEVVSPRGVLEGPGSFADSYASSPSDSYVPVGWSPFNSKKALLSPQSVGSEDGRGLHDSRQRCVSLWKNMSMRRWHTFPPPCQKSVKRSPSHFLTHNVLKICHGPSPVSPSPSFDREQAGSFLCSALADKPNWRAFTIEELVVATNNFHPDNLVGRGGYAQVFKGTLPDGKAIAVKKLTKGQTVDEKEMSFLSELGIVGHVSHRNANALIGFCIEGGLHLVFHYLPHGNLASLLYGSKVLEWGVRFKVAVGTARGLHYLHKQCPRRIIHRDIKASNILLGPDFEPQISDFGLAKWLPESWTHHTVTPVEGTFGYLAPEYFMHGIVDEKTDVFAYGVLLLELITGQRSINASQQSLVMWARPYLESQNVDELVDPRLDGSYDHDEMHRMVLAAMLCVRQSPVWRPAMRQVLSILADEDTECEMPIDNWRSLVFKSGDFDNALPSHDEYSSDNYSNDLNRHRALALEF